MLYEESDSGTIWRLSARGFTQAAIDDAGQGTPANPAPANPNDPPAPDAPVTITITGAAQLDDTSVFVVMTEQYENTKLSFVLSMKLENGEWKVDDLLIPLFSLLEATAQGS